LNADRQPKGAVADARSDQESLRYSRRQLIINQLAADFEQRTGYRITQLLGHADMPMHVKPRIDAGEAFDAVFLVPAMLDQLANEGKIINETRTNFLRRAHRRCCARRAPLSRTLARWQRLRERC